MSTALPKTAADLLAVARANGWRTAVGHAEDSGGSPYATVEIGRKVNDEVWHYKLCWHTRGTGTYRLFTKLSRTPDAPYWHDAPSLKAIRATLESVSELAA